MLVSVVIPAHQSNDYLKKCLKSINSQNYSNYEVIVVSDNSKEVEDYVKQEYSHFKILNTHYEGHGVAKARNLGADSAKGELLIFIDSDCLAPSNLIQTYVENYMENCLMIGGIERWDDKAENLLEGDLRDIFHILNENSSKDNLNKWWFEDISWSISHTLNFKSGNCAVDRNSFLEGFRFNEELLGFEDLYYAIEHYSLYERIKYIDTFVKHLQPTTDWRKNKLKYNYKIFYDLVKQNYPVMLEVEQFIVMINMLEQGMNL